MKCAGFTLMEGLVTLVVAAILTTAVIPAFADLLARQRATAAVNQLVGAIHMTRHAAISHRRRVALCASAAQTCLGRNQWHQGVMVFVDANRDGSRQASEAVITQLPPLHSGASVVWRAFQNKSYLRFRANGSTDWQNGSFTYCPPDGDLRLAKSITINVQGRIALSADRDNDGVDEDARGRRLRCA